MAAALLAAKIRAESGAPAIKETYVAPESNNPVRNWRRLWIIAAAVLLIIAAALSAVVMHR
jgi:ferric-dicitrate binding protein FerR (iron transport regulator)